MIGEHTDGTHAELIAVPETNVYPIPDDSISFEDGRRLPARLRDRVQDARHEGAATAGRVGADLGIGGGVATAAFAIARRSARRRSSPRRSDAKLERARGSAPTRHRPRDDDVAAAAKELTGGGDLVVETRRRGDLEDSLGACAAGGTVVVCGATSGPNPPAQLHRIWWKQLTVYGSTMGTRDDFLGAYGLVRSGRVRVHIDSTFPLSEIRAAHERLDAGEQLGKIVLTIP